MDREGNPGRAFLTRLPKMHRKRWISAVELVLASALIIYAFVGISLPSDEWNNWASYSIPATFAGVPTYAVKP
ncbi:MAG TPA: hypothetical protein VJR06_04705, partial [Nitrososphaerales archaeon]|nr:hypothetical protein [Nitrososphaerales archaeon]